MPIELAKDARPVTILTGFLGAGKTTYLNHLLNSNPNTRYAIIENEYGEQSIDSELIIRAEDDIVELNNGCLCCTLNENLYDILNTLFDRRNEYEEIIIEATGVADPRGLAEPFIIHNAIKKQFPLTAVVCLIDAELIEDQLEETEEAIHQITFSDVLLINKTDLVSEQYLDILAQKLKQLNPLAKIVFGNQENFPTIESTKRDAELDAILEQSKKKVEGEFPVHKPHHHHHHEHTKVVSHTIFFDQPFDAQKLNHRLMVYLAFQSSGLYRMKGLIWVADSEEQYLLQSVSKQLNISPKRSWRTDEKRQSMIVFIGKDIQRKGLEKMLGQCLATPVDSLKT
ncbi:MAG: GTP-binding protein [Bacteroidota bacterium]